MVLNFLGANIRREITTSMLYGMGIKGELKILKIKGLSFWNLTARVLCGGTQ